MTATAVDAPVPAPIPIPQPPVLNTPDTRPKFVFITLPTYSNPISPAVRAAFQTATKHKNLAIETRCSLLAQSFNIGVCELKTRMEFNEPWTHFAMLHADIHPEDWWVDTLLDVMDEHDADVVSALVPIKNNVGMTSCGIADPKTNWSPLFRITMQQAMRLPETFTAADCGHPDKALLVNTGCMLIRARRNWFFDMPAFNIGDRMVRKAAFDDKGQHIGYKWVAEVEPEDWKMSRWFHARGLKAVCTRRVKLTHHGLTMFPNDQPWGSHREDVDLNAAAARELSMRLGMIEKQKE